MLGKSKSYWKTNKIRLKVFFFEWTFDSLWVWIEKNIWINR